MARKPEPAAEGIFLRKKSYWLRYTLGGAQHRIPLHTRDFAEAVRLARSLRGKKVPGKTEALQWDAAIRRYLEDKEVGHRPEHLAGRPLRTFRPGTATRTASILRRFQKFSKCPSPAEVAKRDLQRYYVHLARKSEASARSSVARVQGFLDHLNCLPGRVQFAADRRPERREVVVDLETSNGWIDLCPRDDLRFVLFCGFHAGLRRREIVHARPAWFSRGLSTLTVPGREEQRLADGKIMVWECKDRETRHIPVSAGFARFLAGFLDRKAAFCLHPEAASRPYRWDFRRPFEAFVRAEERPDCTIHSMRHSWITQMCNSGNHTIMDVAAWSGDGIEVIEKNYWKKQVRAGGLDDTMSGKRSSDALKNIAEQLRTVQTTGLDPEVVDAIKKISKLGAKAQPEAWEWTELLPPQHREMYSVEDTIADRGIFGSTLGDEDDNRVDKEAWEEGRLSTKRARLRLLKQLGFIRPAEATS